MSARGGGLLQAQSSFDIPGLMLQVTPFKHYLLFVFARRLVQLGPNSWLKVLLLNFLMTRQHGCASIKLSTFSLTRWFQRSTILPS
jgi:hypothetical protein